VGDIVLVKQNAMVPCDMILLSTIRQGMSLSAFLEGHGEQSSANLPDNALEVDDDDTREGDHGSETHQSTTSAVENPWKNRSSNAKPAATIGHDAGQCYLDRSNINGETNLQIQTCPALTRILARDVHRLARTAITLICEPPNRALDTFTGRLFLSLDEEDRTAILHTAKSADTTFFDIILAQIQQADPMSGPGLPLTAKSLILRETTLRNTPAIIGMVVYTGIHSKIEQSNVADIAESLPTGVAPTLSGSKRKTNVQPKQTKLMRLVNEVLVVMFIFQAILCIVAGVCYGVWLWKHGEDAWYLRHGRVTQGDAAGAGILATLSWVILTCQMVPISLIVSTEIVKFAQSRFIEWDGSLYDYRRKKPLKCNNSLVHEDLASVDFVLSDKTGTLTENKMEFRCGILALEHQLDIRKLDVAMFEAKTARNGLRRASSTSDIFSTIEYGGEDEDIGGLSLTLADASLGTTDTDISRRVRRKRRLSKCVKGLETQSHDRPSGNEYFEGRAESRPRWSAPHTEDYSIEEMEEPWTVLLLHELGARAFQDRPKEKKEAQELGSGHMTEELGTEDEMLDRMRRSTSGGEDMDLRGSHTRELELLPLPSQQSTDDGELRGVGKVEEKTNSRVLQLFDETTQPQQPQRHITTLGLSWVPGSSCPRDIDSELNPLGASPTDHAYHVRRSPAVIPSSRAPFIPSRMPSTSSSPPTIPDPIESDSYLTSSVTARLSPSVLHTPFKEPTTVVDSERVSSSRSTLSREILHKIVDNTPPQALRREKPRSPVLGGSHPSQIGPRSTTSKINDSPHYTSFLPKLQVVDFTPPQKQMRLAARAMLEEDGSREPPRLDFDGSAPSSTAVEDLVITRAGNSGSSNASPAATVGSQCAQPDGGEVTEPQTSNRVPEHLTTTEKSIYDALVLLWSDRLPGEQTDEQAAQRRASAFNWMVHVALSNTIVPVNSEGPEIRSAERTAREAQLEAERDEQDELSLDLGIYSSTESSGDVIIHGGRSESDRNLERVARMAAKSCASVGLTDAFQIRFQAESAEEAALSEFARKVGFTKRRHPSQGAGLYRLEVTIFDSSFSLQSRKLMYIDVAHIATFGFSSKRARVSVIYELRDVTGVNPEICWGRNLPWVLSKPIIFMIKGQDSVLLPLFQFDSPDESPHFIRSPESIRESTSTLAVRGLRALVFGHASLERKWWVDRADEYAQAIQRCEAGAVEEATTGTSNFKRAESIADELFERYEREAKARYVGTAALEDRLQPLAPECIRDFIQAGIKVWMITGDKLEAAKSIGIACNLIDSDMQPIYTSHRRRPDADAQERLNRSPSFSVRYSQSHASSIGSIYDEYELEKALMQLRSSRVLEITGQWASIREQTDELVALFSMLDPDNDGFVDIDDLGLFLDGSGCGVDAKSLESILKELSQVTAEEVGPDENRRSNVVEANSSGTIDPEALLNETLETDRSCSRHPGYATVPHGSQASSAISRGKLNLAQFVQFMKAVKLHIFDAVLHDIQEAISAFVYHLRLTLNQSGIILDTEKTNVSSKNSHQVSHEHQSHLDSHDEDLIERLRRSNFKMPQVALVIDREAFVGLFPAHQSPDLIREVEAISEVKEDQNASDTLSSQRDIFDESNHGPLSRLCRRKQGSEPQDWELNCLREQLFLLAAVARSVIFARAAPVMKKQMTAELKARIPSSTVLAIGDGANDVDMIRTASVGVGVSGVEGAAASVCADYSMGTFRMLHTLIFVHGYWSQSRIANLVTFVFYKAALLAFSGYLFGIYSSFSGQQFFNDPILQLYNILFTAFPVLLVAVWDQPLPAQLLENSPQLISDLRDHPAFSRKKFYLWILRAAVHGTIAFYCGMWVLDSSTADLATLSTTVYFIVALLPNLMIFFNIHTLNVIILISVILSCGFTFAFIALAAEFPFFNPELFGVVKRMYVNPRFWLALFTGLALPCLIEMGARHISRMCWPTLPEIVREQLYLDRRFETRQRDLRRLREKIGPPGPGQDTTITTATTATTTTTTTTTASAAATRSELPDPAIKSIPPPPLGRRSSKESSSSELIMKHPKIEASKVQLPGEITSGRANDISHQAAIKLLRIDNIYKKVRSEIEAKYTSEIQCVSPTEVKTDTTSSPQRTPMQTEADRQARSPWFLSNRLSFRSILSPFIQAEPRKSIATEAEPKDEFFELSQPARPSATWLFQALLRFRKLAGSAYDSSAQARFQTHAKLSRKHE